MPVGGLPARRSHGWRRRAHTDVFTATPENRRLAALAETEATETRQRLASKGKSDQAV